MSQAQNFVTAFMSTLAGEGVVLNSSLTAVLSRVLTNQVAVDADGVVTPSGNFDTLAQLFTFLVTPTGTTGRPATPVAYPKDKKDAALEAAKEAVSEDTGTPSQTIALVKGAEVVTGTAADDTFKGVVGTAAQTTLDKTDSIDGGLGNDTLKVALDGNFAGFTNKVVDGVETGFMKNVENVVLTNAGTIARSFSGKGIEGVEAYTLNGSVNLRDLAAAGIAVNVKDTAAKVSIAFDAKAVEGKEDALTLGLTNVGTAAIPAVGTKSAVDAKPVEVTATGIEHLTVNAEGVNVVDLSKAATNTITAAGAGSLQVTAINTGVTAFDASAVAGAVDANLTGAGGTTLETIKTGAGDDVVSINLDALAPIASLDGGAGNNTLKIAGKGTLEPTISNFQTLEVNGLNGATTISGAKITDVTDLVLKGTTNAFALTVANLGVEALNLTTVGEQATDVTLAVETALTYNTKATDEFLKTAKSGGAMQNVIAKIGADSATSAVINIGAFTSQNSAISVSQATEVAFNVAKDGAFTNKLTAVAAEGTLAIKADGALSGGAEFVATKATELDVVLNNVVGATSKAKFTATAAETVNITATAKSGETSPVKFLLDESSLTAANTVNLTANNLDLVGNTTSKLVNLAKISELTLAGTGAAAAIKLGTLGAATSTSDITVNAAGLKGGVDVGDITTKGAVNLNLAGLTGQFGNGTAAPIINAASVAIDAASLGETAIGKITAAENGDVTITAGSLLGAAGLVVGNIEIAGDAGSINATIAGGTGFTLGGSAAAGTLKAAEVNIDASGFYGTDATKTVIGVITATNANIIGAGLAANAITVEEGIKNLSFTGGVGKDVLTLKGAHDFIQTGTKLTLSGVEAIILATDGTDTLTVTAADLAEAVGNGLANIATTAAFGTAAAIKVTEANAVTAVQIAKGLELIHASSTIAFAGKKVTLTADDYNDVFATATKKFLAKDSDIITVTNLNGKTVKETAAKGLFKFAAGDEKVIITGFNDKATASTTTPADQIDLTAFGLQIATASTSDAIVASKLYIISSTTGDAAAAVTAAVKVAASGDVSTVAYFAIKNTAGTETNLYKYASDGKAPAIQADELTLVGTITSTAALVADDFMLA